MTDKKSISAFQLFFILIHIQVGVAVISLPYDIYLKAGRDAWISVIITGILIQLLILLYGLLIKRFPTHNLYDIICIIFGKVCGKAIIFLYGLAHVLFASVLLAQFVYLLKAWMMPHTPKWLLLALMCFTAAFVVKENIQIIGRFVVIASVVFIGFIGSAAYALKYSTFTYLLPIAQDGILPILEGLPTTFFAFKGFEIMLILYPFVKSSPAKVIKVASGANLFVTSFYLFLVVVCMVFFSSEEIILVPEPVLYLIKAFSFRIIERPDLIFTAMWIVLVATTLTLGIYISSLALSSMKRTKELTTYAIIVATTIFIVSSFINDRRIIKMIGSFQEKFLIPVMWALPIILLLLALLRRKKEEVHKS